MKKKNIVIALLSVAAVGVIGGLFFYMQTNGTNTIEETNKTAGMEFISREEAEPVLNDTITYGDVTVNLTIPEGFYFEYENTDIEAGILKEYMDYDYSRMLDLYIYETHVGDVGLIDDENSENSVVLKDITIDADEWFREMRIVYLERDDESDIKTIDLDGKQGRYITKYFENKDGIMQGTLIGLVELDDIHYYCVKIVEFDKDSEPDVNNYIDLFSSAVK